ncbi:transmembrane protein EpsG [Pullulanibacillus camelliae]|uniref:Transmembrane protein EpsG n=1 Tax=Pullulanibacillus camelliae TaxID=1707096 RepID=A0A8J2YCE6_9BACL|nr:EpsG family protein [Pullulanibacillus camelliae]GGE30466.1 transmembrane protein EpsG [Pullulanibacillus camelliae]
MEILWLNFGFVYLFSLFSRLFSNPIKSEPYVRPHRLLVFLVMACLICVAGLRQNIGDTYFYMHAYKVGDFQLNHIDFKDEFGFYFLQWLLHHFSNNPQMLIFTTACITNMLIVLVLYHYSRFFELSIYILITSGAFTVSMNGIRQALAAAILFAATAFLLHGYWKRYIVVVLLAATIHQSALIFIPIYFIVRRKAWTKVTFLLLLCAVVIAFSFNTFSTLLFDALSDTKYEHYSQFSEGGASLVRVAVSAVPLIIAYFGRERLRALWDKSDIIVNLSLLGFIFMVIATKNWIFARFDIYFDLYSILLISWLIPLFVKQNRYFIYYGLIVCYFIYYYYEQVQTLMIDYHSQYLKW